MSVCFCYYSELCRTNYRKKTAILVIKLRGCFVFKFENYSNLMEVFFSTIKETRDGIKLHPTFEYVKKPMLLAKNSMHNLLQ